MKHLNNYKSFLESKKINEEFIGNLLSNLLPSWLKDFNVKNKRRIDKSISTYKSDYEEVNKKLSEIFDNEDDKDLNKERISKIKITLDKKKEALDEKLKSELNRLTKGNQKSREYANFKRTTVKLDLINSEIEQYEGLDKDIDNDYIENLKKNSKNLSKERKESENKIKKYINSESIEINLDNIKEGDFFLYQQQSGKKIIVKVVNEDNVKKLIRVSDEVDNKDFQSKNKQERMELFNIGNKDVKSFPEGEISNNIIKRLQNISKDSKEYIKNKLS